MEELKLILEKMGSDVIVTPVPFLGDALEVTMKGHKYHFFKDGEVVRLTTYLWKIENGKLVVK